jgi:hypothetical protein
MNFILVLAVWLLLAAVLVVGVVLATKGILSMLLVSLVLFTLAFARWGCLTH